MKEGSPKPLEVKVIPYAPHIQKDPYALVQEISKTQAYQQRRFMMRNPRTGKGKK